MPSGSFVNDGSKLVGTRIDHGRLEFVQVLGYGAYGVVYRALDVAAARVGKVRQYAVKCMQKAGLDSRQRTFQRREIALHQLASAHPNVVTMHRVLEEGDYIFVVLDYCEDGDLFGMITESQRYVSFDSLIKDVFVQIIDAVAHCHSMGIYHRDLKPENILCRKQGKEVLLADFGLATAEKTSTDFGCGSVFYMSPECQGGIFGRIPNYTTASNDVWSLGVILVNLTCGRNPWRQAYCEDDTFKAFLSQPDFLRTILPISTGLNYILNRIFQVDPRQRITLPELRELILSLDTFTMSEQEVAAAHAYAQVQKLQAQALADEEAAAAAAAAAANNNGDYFSQHPQASGPSHYVETESVAGSSGYSAQSEMSGGWVTPANETTAGSPPQTPYMDLDRSRSSGGSSQVDSVIATPEQAAADASAEPIPIDCNFDLSAPVAQPKFGQQNIVGGPLRIAQQQYAQ